MRPKFLFIFAALLLAASCNQTQVVQTPLANNNQQAQAPANQPTTSQPAGQAPSNNNNQPQTTAPVATSTADALAGLGGTKYSNGVLPLGDNKYVTNGPQKGYVYLCHAQTGGGGGAGTDGPWISTTTWNINQKTAVAGNVSWPNAGYSMKLSGSNRIITTNDLPTDHTTGVFPISSSDPAYQYDRNPNIITAQNFTFTLPASPSQTASPNCIGGEVGVMTSGVVLFNGFDAEGRDAAAHEVQDHCQAHPQESGIYHYHSLSSCIPNATISNVIGFAFDGFPITGPSLGNGKYLTTDDLDECHGLTSTITLDGKQVNMYHYVMTEDFPYSISCFRGKNTITGPLGGAPSSNNNQNSGNTSAGQTQQPGGSPPQAAIDACTGKTSGASCTFSPPGKTITGSCQTPPGQNSLACVPAQ